MNNISKNPLKLFIQDIYRAEETPTKYVYKIFGKQFKNLHIHGVVTAVYNENEKTTNLELSDPTGTVHIYYDSAKNNFNIPKWNLKTLRYGFEKASRFSDPNIQIMNTLMERITKKVGTPTNFEEGSVISVIGDIFIDDVRDIRMVSAYQCMPSSMESDLLWCDELNHVYENYYIPNLEIEDSKS